MCGITGIVSKHHVTERLIRSLRRLEYRGYDSSGLAVMGSDGELQICRAEGRIDALQARLATCVIDGTAGIAHTRWATHGKASETNAHPHISGQVAIVHNGIIENFGELRTLLSGRMFNTQTDSEIIAHLIDQALSDGHTAIDAFKRTLGQLKGAYAIAVLIKSMPQQIFIARSGAPLAIALGTNENYVASDAIALAHLSEHILYLEEGDWAVVSDKDYRLFDKHNQPAVRPVTQISGGPAMAEKGNYRHFMLKEIYEQPETTSQVLNYYINEFHTQTHIPHALDIKSPERLTIVACGTAFYAASIAKYWFERYARIPVDVDIGSEFRYRQPVLSKNSLFLAISQSGETADTLAALRHAKDCGQHTAALVNVMSSTLAREADIALPIHAGPEIGVASTKAFTAQLVALATLAIAFGRVRNTLSSERHGELLQSLIEVPRLMNEALALNNDIKAYAHILAKSDHAFYLGRDVCVPLAYEGALKLKELAYIHAQAYAAGELKHGPIALIEDGTPVIFIAPYNDLFEKNISNMQEVAARGADIYWLTDARGAQTCTQTSIATPLILPTSHEFVAPIIIAEIVQLLAYHTAVHRGTDIDQPRNLAKSVTVE